MKTTFIWCQQNLFLIERFGGIVSFFRSNFKWQSVSSCVSVIWDCIPPFLLKVGQEAIQNHSLEASRREPQLLMPWIALWGVGNLPLILKPTGFYSWHNSQHTARKQDVPVPFRRSHWFPQGIERSCREILTNWRAEWSPNHQLYEIQQEQMPRAASGSRAL